MNYTPRQLVHLAEARFAEHDLCYGHGTDNPRDEAVYLVFSVLELPFDCDDALLDKPVGAAACGRIVDLITDRLATRKPVAYLVQKAWFCGMSFYVDERVLIPRSPLAELIEQRFSPWIKEDRVADVLDIGTGSGCIAAACAMAFPQARVDAVDIDQDALEVAAINVTTHRLDSRVSLQQSDLFSNLSSRQYDIIISNPPYVSAGEMAALPAEYHHEPQSALQSGCGGLDAIQRLLQAVGGHLRKDGILVVETGNSKDLVAERFSGLPFVWLEFDNGGDGVFLLTAEDLR